MTYMKRFAIATLAVVALLVGCADDEQLGTVVVPEAVVEAESTAKAQPVLSPEQQLMKQQLDRAAQLMVGVLNKAAVQRELHQLDYLKTEIEEVSFQRLLRNPAKDSRFLHLGSELSRAFDANAKGGDAALMDYLLEQGCGLYMPVPLSDYEVGTPITVVGDPMDNGDEGIGYVFDASMGTQRTVLVNEEYVEKNPILVVTQPQRIPSERVPGREDLMPDPGWGDGGGGGSTRPVTPIASEDIVGDEDFPEDRAGKICKVEIGAVHLARQPKLWKATVVRIGRANASGQSVDYVEFTIPYNVARAAYKGWTQHGDGGWVDKTVPTVWDTRWYCRYVDQILYAYIKRGDEKFTANISVKYKEYVNIQLGMKEVQYKDKTVEVGYAGEDVCHSTLNRTSFIRTLKSPSGSRVSPVTGERWPLYGFGDLTLAIRVVWL